MRLRRAILFTPGNDLHKIRKVSTFSVDSVCIDLQAALGENNKESARETVAYSLQTLDFGETETLVRINPVDTDDAYKDLSVVLKAHPDGIVIPHVEDESAIQWVSRQIEAAESENKWPEGEIVVLATIATAKAIINLPKICTADSRIKSLLFSAEDFAIDVGAKRTIDGTEVLYARSNIVLNAAAYKLQAIDMVNLNFKDLNNLRKEANQAVEMGFAGKQIIHPNQIEVVQQAFTPNENEILEAKEIIQAYQSFKEEGTGVFGFNGKLITSSVRKTAESIIERARAAGKID